MPSPTKQAANRADRNRSTTRPIDNRHSGVDIERALAEQQQSNPSERQRQQGD